MADYISVERGKEFKWNRKGNPIRDLFVVWISRIE